ncbi:glutaredoxin [Acidihalobacter yilgarnensis]|uniref:Glutaredoxin n=1 Tax=Acidihalobacter yilgarnensis TaxID=2819280 RepID=A0A1D8IRW2_9GAMM|nr:glutathione S-transferase N-terminal domain-containing protein [Acidihalobacter yilgarnensis]AOU99143.1 glutaredoxin [Acidihalobacter yilgarnensis]
MRPLIRFFFRTVRLVLTPFVITIDRMTTPKGIDRPADVQAKIDEETRALTLYHFRSCPFCIKTRRAMKRMSLNIELRDTQHDPENREALHRGGGEIKVPCLRIEETDGEVRWMYESDAIIEYLTRRFAPSQAA